MIQRIDEIQNSFIGLNSKRPQYLDFVPLFLYYSKFSKTKEGFNYEKEISRTYN